MSPENNNNNRNRDRRRDVEYSEIVEPQDIKVDRRARTWEEHKYFYAFSYFLFFVPLFTEDTRRSRFYVNQGLMVWLWLILGNVVINYLGYIDAFEPARMTVQWIYSGIIFALALYGFIATLLDRKDVRLPIIGMINLVK